MFGSLFDIFVLFCWGYSDIENYPEFCIILCSPIFMQAVGASEWVTVLKRENAKVWNSENKSFSLFSSYIVQNIPPVSPISPQHSRRQVGTSGAHLRPILTLEIHNKTEKKKDRVLNFKERNKNTLILWHLVITKWRFRSNLQKRDYICWFCCSVRKVVWISIFNARCQGQPEREKRNAVDNVYLSTVWFIQNWTLEKCSIGNPYIWNLAQKRLRVTDHISWKLNFTKNYIRERFQRRRKKTRKLVLGVWVSITIWFI